MPLSALVDDPSAHSRARMVVSVVGWEDCAFVNNEFTVYLGGSNALRFVTEPEDVTAQEGEDVAFTVHHKRRATDMALQYLWISFVFTARRPACSRAAWRSA